MANYRQIHVSIWKDEWFLDLEPDEKLLFIYLFSNEATSISGIYKLAMKVIAFESGLPIARINEIMAKFSKAGKVHYEDGIVWVVNMSKYHATSSDKVKIRVASDVQLIPDCPLKQRYINSIIGYAYPIHTQPQLKEKEKEVKEEEEEEEEKRTASPSSNGRIVPVKILCDASGLSDFPGDMRHWHDVIYSLAQDHGTEATTAAMKKACARWVSTIGKNGRPYRKTNLAWINFAQEILAGGSLDAPEKTTAEMTDQEYIEWAKRQVEAK